MLNSLVRQLISEGRPTSIEYGFRHVGFGESGGIDVAYRNIVKLSHDAIRKFVVKVISAIGGFDLYRLDTPLLVSPLRHGQLIFCAAITTGSHDGVRPYI